MDSELFKLCLYGCSVRMGSYDCQYKVVFVGVAHMPD